MKLSLSSLWIASLAPSGGVSATAVAAPEEPRQAVAAALQRRRSGFAASCPDYWLNPSYTSTLQAHCYTRDGKRVVLATLFLNNCLANIKGELRGQEKGQYGGSCDTRSCVLDGTRIECSCKDAGGRGVKASVDLNDFIINLDGRLTCFGDEAA